MLHFCLDFKIFSSIIKGAMDDLEVNLQEPSVSFVRLQYLSDLNLESKPSKFKRLLKPNGEILILAGNIGRPGMRIYDQFLHWCTKRFPYVILVPGNMEYYQNTLGNANNKLQRLCKKYGIYLLDKDLLEIPEWNLVIIGSTLWPKIPEEEMFEALKYNKDFREIWGFSLSIEEELHLKGKKWLESQIKFYRIKNPEYAIVVVTHHQPFECSSIMKGVSAWIHGHEGSFKFSQYGKTLITSNKRGSQKFSKEENLTFRDKVIMEKDK